MAKFKTGDIITPILLREKVRWFLTVIRVDNKSYRLDHENQLNNLINHCMPSDEIDLNYRLLDEIEKILYG